MTPLTVVVAALILGLLFGTIAVWGAPIFAIPIVLIAAVVLGAMQIRRRARYAQSMEKMRDEAASEKVEFTERDHETLA